MATKIIKKKIIKKSYTLWITIEQHTEFSDGTEKYEDLKNDDTRSVGRFTKIKDAREQMQTLGDIHMGDGDVKM